VSHLLTATVDDFHFESEGLHPTFFLIIKDFID
jgi:hypothetical protein